MKTRLQSMKYVDGVPEYKGAGDVLGVVVGTARTSPGHEDLCSVLKLKEMRIQINL